MTRPMTAERWRRTLRTVSRRSELAWAAREPSTSASSDGRDDAGLLDRAGHHSRIRGSSTAYDTSTTRFTIEVGDGDDDGHPLDDDVVAARDGLEQGLAHARSG